MEELTKPQTVVAGGALAISLGTAYYTMNKVNEIDGHLQHLGKGLDLVYNTTRTMGGLDEKVTSMIQMTNRRLTDLVRDIEIMKRQMNSASKAKLRADKDGDIPSFPPFERYTTQSTAEESAMADAILDMS